jgi:hypothetical protein
MGVVKSNPLHIIEEEVSYRPASNKRFDKINFFEKLIANNATNNTSNSKNSEHPIGNNVSSSSKRPASMYISNIANNSRQPSERTQSQLANRASIQSAAANAGIRNGIFAKLGSYKPQWIDNSRMGSSTNISIVNTSNGNETNLNKSKFNFFSTNDLYNSSNQNGLAKSLEPSNKIGENETTKRYAFSRYSSHDNLNHPISSQSKLKYSESERLSMNNPNFININPNNNIEPRYAGEQKSNMNKHSNNGGSFTQKVLTLVSKKNNNSNNNNGKSNINLPADYPNNGVLSEFILKPSSFFSSDSSTTNTLPLSNSSNTTPTLNNQMSNGANNKVPTRTGIVNIKNNSHKFYFGGDHPNEPIQRSIIEIGDVNRNSNINNDTSNGSSNSGLKHYQKKTSLNNNFDNKFYSSEPHLALSNKASYNGFYY